MSYDEFQRRLGQAGLTPKGFAELVNLSPTALANYARQAEVPAQVAVIVVLLGEMARREIDFREVLSGIDIAPHKVRRSGQDQQSLVSGRQTLLDL